MAGPLKGIRVLDFGMAAVGPLATTYLGLLGADVIKVEQPSGDIPRGMGTIPKVRTNSTTFPIPPRFLCHRVCNLLLVA